MFFFIEITFNKNFISKIIICVQFMEKNPVKSLIKKHFTDCLGTQTSFSRVKKSKCAFWSMLLIYLYIYLKL